MAQSSMLHVHVDEEVKEQATQALACNGNVGVRSCAHLSEPGGCRSGISARTEGAEFGYTSGDAGVTQDDEIWQ